MPLPKTLICPAPPADGGCLGFDSVITAVVKTAVAAVGTNITINCKKYSFIDVETDSTNCFTTFFWLTFVDRQMNGTERYRKTILRSCRLLP